MNQRSSDCSISTHGFQSEIHNAESSRSRGFISFYGLIMGDKLQDSNPRACASVPAWNWRNDLGGAVSASFSKYHPEEIKKLPALYSSKMNYEDLQKSLKLYHELITPNSPLNCVAGNIDRAVELRLGIDSNQYRIWIDADKGVVKTNGQEVGLKGDEYIRVMVARKGGENIAIVDLQIPLEKLNIEGGRADDVRIRAAGIPVATVKDRMSVSPMDERPSINTVINTLEQTQPMERHKLPYLSAHSFSGGFFAVTQMESARYTMETLPDTGKSIPIPVDRIAVTVGVNNLPVKKTSLTLPTDGESVSRTFDTPYAEAKIRMGFSKRGKVAAVKDTLTFSSPEATAQRTSSGYFAAGTPELVYSGRGGTAETILNNLN